ncbi:connector protein [Bacillus phage SRT01hs]|uniref:Connector protein n=1 Tax=Bacillus phage SRT01hs TaxID=2847044 RepID=A0A6B9SWE2_9CAUD|nr:upper collar connector [Bacillus phage SRT01hs]QHJ75886.1 connector protein [Bacillus phage SRT01hs]
MHNDGFAYKTIGEIQRKRGNLWFYTYQRYLFSLAYQMFEWSGLPKTVDPVFLEKQLHQRGFVAFYKDEMLGYLGVQGTLSGQVNLYNQPNYFTASAPTYQKSFPLYWYDLGEEFREEGQGIVIYNNLEKLPTLDILNLYAMNLAELKETIYVNQNAQKTPVLIKGGDNTLFSLKQIYNKYEGNEPVIIADRKINTDDIEVLRTDAPYVADKLTMLFKDQWNEAMTFLGLSNANTDKKERLIQSEVESNNDQIQGSANIYLATRQEAAKMINEYYGLNVSVRLRKDVENGGVHDAVASDNRVGDSVQDRSN